MNYIERIREKLQEKLNFSEDYIGLLDVYALLVLVKGEYCTSKDVHDAWSVWQNGIDKNHQSLIPFYGLKEKVRKLDDKYRDLIIRVSKSIKGPHCSCGEDENQDCSNCPE